MDNQMLVEILLGELVVIVVLGATLGLLYHKLSLLIHHLRTQLDDGSNNVVTQVEALLALQSELKFDHALPPTRGWAASPDFLRNLVIHAREARPKNIVECSSGISTVVLARCAQLNGAGHVFSLEHEPEYAEKTRALLRRHGLEAFATVLDAPLLETQLPDWQGKWYRHAALPDDLTIDMLVIDGPPGFAQNLARYPAIPLLHGRLNAQSAVFLDDASRPDEKIATRMWLDAYSDLQAWSVPACEKGCFALRKVAAAA